jgi:tetratricopeptide (TPR) repeat protein
MQKQRPGLLILPSFAFGPGGNATIAKLKMACLDENQVLALVHGRLSGDELQAAQEHLDGCMDCLDLVGFYQQSAEITQDDDETHDHEFVPLSESEEIELNATQGSKIGRYEVIRSLGRGGMGVVYLARDPELDRPVALKLVKPSLQADERADHFEKRLMREARAMAKLAHPNVLTIYDVGIQEGSVFLASEWVDGCTLDEWMSEGPHRWPPVAARFREAARGLVAAHAAGLVHRDFKPSNVMVGKDERVRVFDFGLVKSTTGSIGDVTTQLSGNFVVGTPAYMSPEQMVGKAADERSDQFSFCASLYEALAGVRPFTGRNLTELLTNIGSGKLDEPKKIPKWLWDMIKRGLKKNPDDRHASMKVVLEILEKGLGNRRRRSVMVAVASLTLVGIAAGATGIWRGQDDSESLCGEEGKALGEAWSQQRRSAVQQSILSSQAPYAADLWHSAGESFDQYAKDWQRQSRLSCVETRAKKQQPETVFERRGLCFSRLRSELDSVTAALAKGEDAAVLRNAVVLAQGLSPVASCSAARAQDEFAADATSEDKERLKKIWPKVKEVDTLVRSERYLEALTLSDPLISKSEGNRQIEARLWASRGSAHRALGQYKEAVLAFEKTFYAAVAGKHDDIAAEATTEIVGILAVHIRDADRAERWRQLAESAVERVDTPLVLGRWRRVQGGAAQAKEDFASAEEHFRASVQILESAFGESHVEVALSLVAMGRCQSMQGKAEAEATLRRAAQIRRALVGARHPDTATAEIVLATALMQQGKSSEAQELVESALESLTASLGEEHPRVASALNSVAQFQVEAGDVEAANRTLLQALRIKRVVHGAHPRLVSTLTNLMEVDRMRDRDGDAVIHGNEALQILEEHSMGTATQIRRLELGVADALVGSGDFAAAQTVCERVVKEAEGITLDAATQGRVLTCLGRVQLAEGKKREGKELLHNAIELLQKGSPSRLALARFALAQSLGSGPAVEEASQAWRLFSAAGLSWAREKAEVEAWLDERGAAIPSP